MATTVWLMRHAETADPFVFHGAESNVGLSELGHRQVAAVVPVVAALKPDAIVSSRMLRARLTAEPIAAACGLGVHVEPLLHERRVGDMCGKPSVGSDGVWPTTRERWLAGDTSYAPPGAESFDAIRDRVMPVWRRLSTDNTWRRVFIVAHGQVIRNILLHVLYGGNVHCWDKFGPIRNVALTELVSDDGDHWRAVRLNELPDGVPPSRLLN